MHAPLKEDYKKKAAAFAQAILDTKKQLFATEEGKSLLMRVYENQSLATKSFLDGWFLNPLKGCDTIPKLMLSNASPDAFVSALEGRSDSHGLNTIIRQARELSYIEGKSLAEVMKERLTASGLTSFQVDFFTEVTQVYEKGGHKAYLQQLWTTHRAEIERLDAAHDAALAEPLARRQPSAGAAVQEAKSLAAEEKTFLSGIKNLSGKARFGIIGSTAVALGTLGYRVWHTKHNKQKEQDTAPKQVAAAR